ncbi:glycosyltransferase [Microbacterium fluvii]|uniref:Glycosyltransferase n=1 Tax=Microbacterium fluvii TaxID=415215 RepID=A0ABW2H9V4_9MICO|nr:glycosyltransferase [Microbacterium fluvii]MCU4671441.1 glycosyltransferase [Microbacterium fluvii]
MPARVHAILVVRPDARTFAAMHLRRTLTALDAQTRRVDALTIVVCGRDAEVHEVAAASGAESVITAPAGTGFAAATEIASLRLGDADGVWLLAQDTAPEQSALAKLAGALELAPSAAFAAPKLVRWNGPDEIVSLGVSMTRFGRACGLADGELDQGQHDGGEDVLAADVRGLLVRAEAWRTLGGLDTGLSGADEGLDLGVRARLAGGRVTVVPAAHIAVAGDGVAGLPAPIGGAARRRIAYASRAAQLHRRLAYAPVWAVALHWLTILPLALWRTVGHLIGKEPGLVWPEWRAAVVALVRLASVARARGRIRRARTASWAQLSPLRISQTQLRERLDDDPDADVVGGVHRGDLRFFSGGGAWLVLAALGVSAAAFTALLVWPVIGGGGLQPLRATVAQLWADAAYGRRALGLETIGPADPFAGVVAVLGSLWPSAPSHVLVILWVLALPLAALGGWFAATRVTERSLLRVAGGVVWMLAPTFLSALVDPRPAAVLVHLLLPWLFFAGSAAHRSWVPAGAASLLLAAVLACAPSLGPALAVVWVGMLALVAVVRGGDGVAKVIWLLVPTIVLFAPLAWYQLRHGELIGLLADPGVTWSGAQVEATASGRALLAAGIPSADLAGWVGFLPEGVPTWWVPLLAAPIAVLALVAPLTVRWAAGVTLLVVAALGLGTAFAQASVAVASTEATAVALWPGTGLSLAWAGVVGAALVTLDTGLVRRAGRTRAALAIVSASLLAVLAVPSLTAMTRGTSALTSGPVSTLPAYVAAEGRDDPDIGTIVLSPLAGGDLAVDVVWGGSETLGGQTTVLATRTTPSSHDEQLAELAADLVTPAADDVIDSLAAEGIGFVLVAPLSGSTADAAATLRLEAVTSLNQRARLDPVGETARGSLWRVAGDLGERAAVSEEVSSVTGIVALGQLLAVAAALLLSVPTGASRRAARRSPRIVGPQWQEER